MPPMQPAVPPPVPSQIEGPTSRQGGSGNLLAAALLLAISGIAIFVAGLNLGSEGIGRDDGERAAVDAFVAAYRSINDEYIGKSDPATVLDGAIRGMFATLDDPYSGYMGPDEFDTTFADIRGEFEGIGARMSVEDAAGQTCAAIGDECRLRVVEVLPGSPALDAGLLADDVVISVDGTPLAGQTIDDAVRLIRGPRDSRVRLTIERGGGSRELDITRRVIVSQDVRSALLADGRIGYLRVDSFSSKVADSFRTALRQALDGGVQGLVLDLRDDPGGFVDAAVAISSEFIRDGPVYWEEDASGSQRAVDVNGGGLAVDPTLKLAVLVNGGTASASEILAGALQDAGRAELVGEPTFGKGTVQQWTQLPGGGGGFRLSVAKWLTRDKTWINEQGLTPDVEVADGTSRFWPALGNGPAVGTAAAADAQLQRAIGLLLEEPGATRSAAAPASSGQASATGAASSPGATAAPTPARPG
jgi:carboxyl-terminal processing protease